MLNSSAPPGAELSYGKQQMQLMAGCRKQARRCSKTFDATSIASTTALSLAPVVRLWHSWMGLNLLLDVDQNFAGWADPLKMIVDGVGVREVVVGVLGAGVGWKQLLGA